ncbi:MAG: Rieske (2Fe-2S) protein, partial [Saprospiraceae bacterium]|nr:Rieske (2Fe-2S) protein [Saprospiraceae bacterium]
MMHSSKLIDPVPVANWDELEDRKPAHALVENTDLVVIRFDEEVSVLYGRCLHRGALLADGHVDEHDNLICGLHQWDYRIDSGVSEYNNKEYLHPFKCLKGDGGIIFIDRADVVAFEEMHPQPFRREEYLGAYSDTHPESTEPYTSCIRELARKGLQSYGHHGPSAAMGVDRNTLPKWEN